MVYPVYMDKRDIKALRGNRRKALLDAGIDPRGPRSQRIPNKKAKQSKDACRKGNF